MVSDICNNAFRCMLEYALLPQHLSLREIQILGQSDTPLAFSGGVE
jgi:hypothetical protein